MAFKIDTSFSGIKIEGSYARIEDFNGSKGGMDFTLEYYVNKQKCENGAPSFKREQFNFVPDASEGAPNYHKQGYEYLKMLPDFSEATDILE